MAPLRGESFVFFQRWYVFVKPRAMGLSFDCLQDIKGVSQVSRREAQPFLPGMMLNRKCAVEVSEDKTGS